MLRSDNSRERAGVGRAFLFYISLQLLALNPNLVPQTMHVPWDRSHSASARIVPRYGGITFCITFSHASARLDCWHVSSSQAVRLVDQMPTCMLSVHMFSLVFAGSCQPGSTQGWPSCHCALHACEQGLCLQHESRHDGSAGYSLW